MQDRFIEIYFFPLACRVYMYVNPQMVMEMRRQINGRIKKHLISLVLIFFFLSNISAQCPTEAQLEGGGTLNIPTDSDCSSPVTCNIATADFWDIDGNFTLLSCATLNLTQGSSFLYILGGTFTIEEGATLTTNRRLIVDGATVIVNGTLDVGDASGNDRLVIEFGGSIVVGATGHVEVGNGDIRVGGNGGGNTGTLDVDGTVNVSGNVTIRNNGTLDGDGMLTFGGDYTNNGTESTNFGNCTGGSNTSCGNTTLPVELISFSASLENDREAVLAWETATELNNEGFFVERSTDGINFSELGFVEGNGTTSNKHSYRFTDKFISTHSYYRLRQVDYDGQFEYSPITFLEYESKGLALKMDIYPNPVSSKLNFRNQIDGVFDWMLIDFSGQSVLSISNLTASQAEVRINELLPKLVDGLYVIKMSNGETQQAIRMMKN